MLLKLVVNLFLCGLFFVRAYKTYEGYKIYIVTPQTENHQKFLVKMAESGCYDFFVLPRIINATAAVMLERDDQLEFETTIEKLGMKYSIKDPTENIDLVRKERSLSNAEYPMRSFDFKNYYRSYDIEKSLENINSAYPAQTKLIIIGESYEKRPIKMILIGNGIENPKKKVIFVDAGSHAREWIAPAAAMYIVQELTINCEKNEYLLEYFDWIILPLANPDGYEYSHTTERYWRKTMKPVTKKCVGTDVNRNFDSHWLESNATHDPCSETYGGESVFSETETRAVRDIMHLFDDKLEMYINLHAYGGYLLYPWGWSSSLPSNWEEVDNVTKAGADAIKSATGSEYKVGTPGKLLYKEGGSSIDYGSEKVEIPYNIAIEIETRGYGFHPPAKLIQPIVEETWIGIKAMAIEVTKRY